MRRNNKKNSQMKWPPWATKIANGWLALLSSPFDMLRFVIPAFSFTIRTVIIIASFAVAILSDDYAKIIIFVWLIKELIRN